MTVFDTENIKKIILSRDYEKVLSICDQALSSGKLTPDEEVSALHFKGCAYYFSNRLGQSIKSFKEALSKDPKHTDSAISLSIIYNDIGKYSEAKQIYTIANQGLKLKRSGKDLNLDRKFSIKHLELGDLYFKFHRYDEAIDDYAKAYRLDPQATSIRIKMAKVYAKKGFTSRAIQELQQLCQENPDDLESRLQLGLMYFSQGNIIDAQVEWERASSIEPQNEEVLQYLDLVKQATETRI